MTEQHFFQYDDRYFQNTKHTREELYKLQSLIMNTKSSDIGKEIEQLGIYENHVIQTCLTMAAQQEIIKKERLGEETIDGKRRPVYRYYANN